MHLEIEFKFLYLGLGDGGSGGDPHNHGQNTETLLGNILRIDVNPAVLPYTNPVDNPFVNRAGRDEIFAFGFRNPWRFSFDRQTHQLWVADVGQNQWEEIAQVKKGENHGWKIMEGAHCYNASSCDQSGLTLPIYEYSHNDGCSVTGGFVYRGSAIPSLQGQYVFADYCTSNLWRLQQQNNLQWQRFTIGDIGNNPSSFAEDNEGEIYALSLSGDIKKLVPGSGAQAPSVPAQLSQTGCVQASSPAEPSAGLIPYDLQTPFWSDGAEKSRWLALPNASQINTTASGDIEYPSGAVLMKHFRLNNALIETRLLMNHGLYWRGYSYRWNAEQTDATLVEVSTTATIQGQNWLFPSGAQCAQCHTNAAQVALGPELRQLNRNLLYPSTNRQANQLATWQHIGLFSPALTQAELQLTMPAANDNNAALAERARSYLHSNCAHCHQPNGTTPSSIDLRYSTTLANTHTCNTTPQHGDLGIANAQIIAPSAPERSVLLQRMVRLDHYRMPPLGSFIQDQNGVNLIQAWINAISTC